jgi:glycosyltransferase involved in cell wall biosynthesis
MVSIIIPVYNRIDLLKLTLESVVNCDDVEKDIVIIDDGSQEDIKSMLLAEFPTLNYNYKKIRNQGGAVARNEGLKLAKSEYISFLDSDDLVESNFFSERIKMLDLNVDLDAVYGPWDHVTAKSTLKNIEIIPRFNSYPIYDLGNEIRIIRNLLGGWYINQCSIMWRKSFFQKLNGYNPKLRINQDVDLVFRALMKGVRLSGANLPRTLYREHDQMRVGRYEGDEFKLMQILNLRKYFIDELEKRQLFTSDLKEELAYFLFEFWADLRITFPEISQQFLKLSEIVSPNLSVRGGKFYVLLAGILGKKNATIIKQVLN